MYKRSFSALLIIALLTGCTKDEGAVKQGSTAEAKLKRYESMIEGTWKWVPTPSQTLQLQGGRSLYIINGKPDRDTGYYSLTLENPNPKAGYLLMAEVFCGRQMVFFKNERLPTIDHTVPDLRKAYAIIGMNKGFIQMMDTETGTIWEFTK